MFHKLLTCSTMTAVVLHALLGCCVHHAHAGQTHSRDVDSATVEVEHHHGHSHDGHSHDGHKQSCKHQPNADGSITSDCIDDESSQPCSGSHGPLESCHEADCNIVADQRDNEISLMLTYDWSPLLTHSLSLSSQDVLALRMEYGSPPDPPDVQSPLRIKMQVWRL